MYAGPLTAGIGKKHGKSGAQVALKWVVQQNIPVIPKVTVLFAFKACRRGVSGTA